jgi:PEP-CTERM motif
MISVWHTRRFARLILIVAATSPLTSSALAEVVTVPAGLQPGDQYRLAFVTSATTFATSTNIATYNNFVTVAADSSAPLAALSAQWSAIGSTSSISAKDNTGTNPADSVGVPIYNLAGQLVASDNAALWSPTGPPIVNPIDVTELGNLTTFDPPVQPSEAAVWTGTDPDGSIDSIDTLRGYLGNPNEVVFGNAAVAEVWIFQGTINNISGKLASYEAFLYGMSSVLTVPAPEPSTLALACFAAAAIGVFAAGNRRQMSNAARDARS